jgi:hypothetical protein
MNFEIFAGIILVASFSVMVWFAWKKASELKNLPRKESILPVKKLKEELKQKTVVYWKGKVPDFYHFLQRTILKTRDLFTKADNKMLDMLLHLKKRTDKGKVELDDYWKDIKANIRKAETKRKAKSPAKETEKELEVKLEVNLKSKTESVSKDNEETTPPA